MSCKLKIRMVQQPTHGIATQDYTATGNPNPTNPVLILCLPKRAVVDENKVDLSCFTDLSYIGETSSNAWHMKWMKPGAMGGGMVTMTKKYNNTATMKQYGDTKEDTMENTNGAGPAVNHFASFVILNPAESLSTAVQVWWTVYYEAEFFDPLIFSAS